VVLVAPPTACRVELTCRNYLSLDGSSHSDPSLNETTTILRPRRAVVR
jgi:hypothetical protein